MLALHCRSPALPDLVDHLQHFYLASAARVLHWEQEAAWPRCHLTPYFLGDKVEWEENAITSVEPCWVRKWDA